MSPASDARFWDRISRKYAADKIADQAGYERTVDRTRTLLKPDDRVLELGCGTGTTALRLAGDVQCYLATDISAGMIAIAEEKRLANPITGLSFGIGTAETPMLESGRFNAVLGFNYLHMVRDVPGTLGRALALLAAGGLFISKTPCLGDMNPLIRTVLLPGMRAIGKAPYVSVFREAELYQLVSAAGFDILATENHATRGNDRRPFIVARKR
ncbi:methyltransferase domain-containing protein [Brevundimonas sp.]|uniref:class I SAM-dependent methyltransferase n=1 Tax=Brevundimonas sp. TaxID=1871086 RepID=UPI00286AC27B|nr:methyltransferase domain-containing protein [Brevundimonas sp.]